MRRATRALAIAAIAGTVAILAFPAFLELRSGGTKAFEPQTMDFALLGASAFAIALGAQVVPWRRMRNIALLGVLSGAALLFGCLAIFSIGLVVLPAGIVVLLYLYR
ncbi:MAG: hypothetical protein M3Y30_08900, partial [Gemmatimonadota bacterium]|nr:hypothetical protein [Gemmatimonadota bacterium]